VSHHLKIDEYRKLVGQTGQMRRYPESGEQVALYQWRDLEYKKYPGLELMFHIPNEGKRTPAQAARWKAEGGKAGVSDNFLPVARRGYHGLWMEMKPLKGKPSTVSESQAQWIADMKSQGYQACVCYGCEEVVQAVKDYYTPMKY